MTSITSQAAGSVAGPVPQRSWLSAAVLYGIALWIFALYAMVHPVAGNSAFLGFTGITWVAPAGHVIFALFTAAAHRARSAIQPDVVGPTGCRP